MGKAKGHDYFKYRMTTPNDFGLTTEEILMAKDSELNKWAPPTKIVGLRKEDEDKRDQEYFTKQKNTNKGRVKRIFASLFQEESEEEMEENGEEIVRNEAVDEGNMVENGDLEDKQNVEDMQNEDGEPKKKKRKKKKKTEVVEPSEQKDSEKEDHEDNDEKETEPKKEKTRKKKQKVTSQRLEAYGIKNPDNFRKKLKQQ